MVKCAGPAVWAFLALLVACSPAPVPSAAVDATTKMASDGGADGTLKADTAPDIAADVAADADAVADAVADAAALADAAVTADVGPDAAATCPTAVVTVTEGSQVLPMTTLHLVGSKSTASNGASIATYKWSVKPPAGGNGAFMPSATVSNPTLLAKTIGTYTICLEVTDSNGGKSCAPACEDVLVVTNSALTVELSWDGKADLDLHFAHALATMPDSDCDTFPDPWFSNPFDCFWFNPLPEWGNANSKLDNPTLDLDNKDGTGPEELNLQQPEGTDKDPMAYSIGVHSFDGVGGGAVSASLAVYIQGALALQFSKVKIQPGAMWYVGKLNWPNTAMGGAKKTLTTCYQSGQSCPAKQNLMWQPNGDWCMTPCYPVPVAVKGKPGACVP